MKRNQNPIAKRSELHLCQAVRSATKFSRSENFETRSRAIDIIVPVRRVSVAGNRETVSRLKFTSEKFSSRVKIFEEKFSERVRVIRVF